MRKIDRQAWATLALTLAVAPVRANDLFWQGGPGEVGASHYYVSQTAESDKAPTSADFANVGASSTVSLADTQSANIGRLRIGHNLTGGGTQGLPGPATFNMTGGTLTLAGASNNVNAGLTVGLNADGTANITGGTVTVGRLVVVGFDNASLPNSGSGTLNLGKVGDTLGAGSMTITLGNLNVGAGLPGTLNVGGAATLTVSAGNFNVGVTSTAAASLSGTAGVTVTGSATIGDNSTSGAQLTISGNANFSATSTVIVGNASATNSSLTIDGNATFSSGQSFTVGNTSGSGNTLNVGGNAVVQIGVPGGTNTFNLFVGRGTSTNNTFNFTGGTVSIANRFLMGNGTSPTAVTNHSGGTLNIANDFRLSDSGGESTYNLSGSGAIVSAQGGIIGRIKGSGTVNQTGGSATFNNRLRIGDAEIADTTQWATGNYNISGGTLTLNLPVGSTLSALSIATNGKGTFTVIGDDATIDVNGPLTVNNVAGFGGTLAYQFEPGDGLSVIDVSGNATFNAGATLKLDTSLAAPTAKFYNLLTAADVVDNGIAFAGPAGWGYAVVPGGNGKFLRALLLVPGDVTRDGTLDRADLNAIINGYENQLTGFANGDLNNDGQVSSDDFALFSQYFTQYGSAGASAVPEPAAALVLSPVVLLAARRRRA